MKRKLFNWKTKLIATIGFVCTFITINATHVLAADGDSWLSLLVDYSQYFSRRTIMMDMFRVIGWKVITGLHFVSSFLEGLLKKSLGFFGFVEYMQSHSIYTSLISVLIATLMAGTLVWIGFKMIISQGQVPQFKTVTQNMFVAIILIVGMPFLMNWLQEGVKIVWGQVDSANSQEISLSLVQNDVTDLYEPLSSDISFEDFFNREQRNNIQKAEDISGMEPTEFYPPDKTKWFLWTNETFESDNGDVLNFDVTQVPNDEGGMTNIIYDMRDEDGPGFWASKMGDLFEVGYYRYTFNFVSIAVGLAAISLAFIYVIFSIISIYIEMAFKLIASPVVLATDLETGQKTKKVLHDIITGFLTVAFEVIAFRMYTTFLTWVGNQNFHWILYLFALAAATLSLINGSKTILNWFGVDLGLNEGRSEFSRFAKWSGLAWAGGKAMQLSKKAGKMGWDKVAGKEGVSHAQGKAENLNLNTGEDEDVPVPEDEPQEKSSVLKDISRGAGYVLSRGGKGLAKDGIEKGKEAVSHGADVTVEGAKKAGDAVLDKTVRPVADTIDGVRSSFAAGQMSGSSAKEMDETEKTAKDREETENVDKNRVVRIHDEEQSDGTTGREALAESTDELRKVRTDVEDMNFENPESAVRQISEQINEGNLSNEEKQQLVKRLEEASTMQPEEAEQHVRQVLEQAQNQENIAPQDAVRQIREETNQAELKQPQDAIRQVNEQMESADFSQPQDAIRQISDQVNGSNLDKEAKQRITQQLEEASTMQPEEAQQHVRQVLEQATSVPNAQESEVTRTVREQIESADFSQPQEAVRQITEQVQKDTNMDSVTTQRVVQQLEQANNMQPEEAQQHVRQVLEQAQNVDLGGQTETVQVKAEVSAPTAAVSQISTATMQPITQSVRQIRDVAGDTVSDKTETITRQVVESAKQPEVVEQTVRRVVQDFGQDLPQDTQQNIARSIRTIREQANHHNWSDEVVKQRVQKEVQQSFSGSDIAETQQQNIVRNITEASVGNTEGTQRVVQQVQSASEATPTQLQRNITRAFSNSFEGANAVMPKEIQQEVRQVLKEGRTSNTPTKDLVQNVVQRVEKMDFNGNERLRETVIDRVKESHIVNEQQLQSNLKQIRKKEKGNISKDISQSK